MNDSVQRYFDAVSVSPHPIALGPWGKARPLDGTTTPAHPLLCHMIDVACVASTLVADILPRETANRVFSGLRPSHGETKREHLRRWICFFVALHDLGKATPAFQMKWPEAVPHLALMGFDCAPPKVARDHGTMGVILVSEALVERGLDETFAWQLARAVAAHHGSFPTDQEVRGRKPSSSELGKNPAWGTARAALVHALAETFRVSELAVPHAARLDDWAFFSALAGLTSVADWVGSMAEHFVYECAPTSLEQYVERTRHRAELALESVGFRRSAPTIPRSFQQLFGFEPRPLQRAVERLLGEMRGPLCVVVEARMGDGKTEAALHVAHTLGATGLHDGIYFALPTQATANQIFERLAAFLEVTRPDELTNLQLLHGEAILSERVRGLLRSVHGEKDAGLVCEHWFLGKKRSLLAPFGAGTIDQALLSVLRTKHAFVRQLGLAGKTVVFDEVHAYDTYTSTLLDRLVAWLGALGASVVILSATLPSRRRSDLLEAYAGRSFEGIGAPRYPRLSAVNATRQCTYAIDSSLRASAVQLRWLTDGDAVLDGVVNSQVAEGGVIGIIRNTVHRAQETYARLRSARARGEIPNDTELLLLHARFPANDRRRLEAQLVGKIGKNGERPCRLLVVGTQTLEQSLDIDFDLLITDLAPIDLVIQRVGRLHRHPRPNRPAGMALPGLWIVAPDGDPYTCDLRRVGAVYEPYVLRRSFLVLRELTALAIPDDIERLVESVYTADERAEWVEPLRPERENFENDRWKEEQLARSRVWPCPRIPDDPFGDLQMPLEEDNPDIAKMLRAETRLGDEGAEIVCLYGDEGSAYLDRARAFPIDLVRSPSAEIVRTLANRTIRVNARGLVPHLKLLPAPAAWRDVSVLARRKSVFFGDVPIRIGAFTLHLDDELGLVIRREEGRNDAISIDD